MVRSPLRMPPFNVEICLCQTLSPTNASLLHGTSLHEHGPKVHFVSGASWFHAEVWPRPPEWTRHGTHACTRCPHVRDFRNNTRNGPGAGQHANEQANEHVHQHAAVTLGLPTMDAEEAKRLEDAELDAEEAQLLEDADWMRTRRGGHGAPRGRGAGRGGRGAPGGRGAGRGGGGAPGGRGAGRRRGG